jgi:cytochrome c
MLPAKLFSRFLVLLLLACSSYLSFAQKPEEKKLTITQKPDDNRFTPVVLAQDLDEPMVFEVAKNGKAYIIERKGGVKVYDPITETTKSIGNITVNTKYTSAEGQVREAEEGLIGMTLDPNFATNHWIYLYYAHPTEKKHILTRWDLVDDKLVAGSEKVLLEVVTQREVCCHTGGGMTWDSKGNLYMTVGNNTGNQQAAQTDERPGKASWDDQGHAGNTMDLRGKILRIHPEPNGTYTIPQGNLFPVGTAKTRPEIYTMGHRNAWRPSIDSKTGFLYWGEVGPDATNDSEIGPRGYDELNQARKPGNFGWPYFVGNDQAFPVFDYANSKPLEKKDPKKPMNNSPNNTGLTELLPTSPSFIYYPYGVSEKFPEVGTGSRSATGGPVFHKSDFAASAKRPFPDYYEGKWIATDFSRGWIMAITMEANGDYKSMERFMSNYHPIEPIDMKFGPDGDLYVLEYGNRWFGKGEGSKLVRIEYNAGNRKPLVEVAAAKNGGGTVPTKIKLSSEGTKDYDGDVLKYEWKVVADAGGTPKVYTTANPEVTLDKAGAYTATLTVTDTKGSKNSASVKMIAGNEPPEVSFNVIGNKSFFFADKPLTYSVSVNDKEDGSIDAGKISPEKVAVSIDYTTEGFDYAEVIQGQRSVDASARFAVAQALMAQSDCKTCHLMDVKSVGPMFTAIAEKYKGDESAIEKLATKVRNGGTGVWGDVTMAAHPALSQNDATIIVKYILGVNDKTISTLPVKGTYTQTIPAGDNGRGSLILRAAYTDAGTKLAPSITDESQVVLKSATVSAASADVVKGVEMKALIQGALGMNAIPTSNGYLGFNKLDLTGVKQLELIAQAAAREGHPGGLIEIRIDSPTGELIGQTEVKVPAPGQGFGGGGAQAIQNAGGAAAPAGGQRAGAPGAGGPGAAPAVAGAPGAPAAGAGQRAGGAGGGGFGRGPVPIKVDVKEVSGVHDIYFVFKNDTAKPIDPLMSFSSIKFKDEKN